MDRFSILCNLSTPGGVVWSVNGDRPIQPEEIPARLKDMIEVKKHKKDRTENRTIFINRLRYFGLDIIQVLHILGYNESKEHSLKKMESKSYTYLIGDNLCFYSIRIKYTKRYNVNIIDLDNFLSISNPVDIISTWGSDKNVTAQNLGSSYIRAVQDVIRLSGIKRKIPVTLSGVARRIFFRERQKYFDCRDCSKFFEGSEPFFRAAYHGGLNFEKDSGYIQEHGEGVVLDVNSLYPYVMSKGVYPVGKPWSVKESDFQKTIKLAREKKIYFFVRILTSFELKPNGIPCVAMYQKDPERWYFDKGFMRDSRFTKPDHTKGKLREVTLTLTQTDFFLYLENYDIKSMHFVSCVAFQAKEGVFTNYVTTWYQLKENSEGGVRRVGKMFLNSLSGSMARRVDYINGLVYFDERDEAQIKYIKTKSENPKCYVHIGSAITSYARAHIIRYIKSNYDRWLYTDTDSLHLLGTDIPVDIVIGNDIGQFKVEKSFDSICYYGLKEYGYHDSEGYHFTMAGVEKRDTDNLSRYLNHQSHTIDTWVNGKKDDVKGMKELFKSKDKLTDVFYIRFPVSYQCRIDWFNIKYINTWKTFYTGDKILKKPKPVHVKGIVTTVKAERERDEKARVWYEKKYKDRKPKPLEEWLKEMAIKEKDLNQTAKEEWKREKAIKSGDFYTVTEKDLCPFDAINEELEENIFN